MRRASGVLLVMMVGACSRDVINDDATHVGDADNVDRAAKADVDGDGAGEPGDAATQISDVAPDRMADVSVAEPPDVIANPDSSDTGQPGMDVGRAPDGSVSDRCGQAFYRESVWPVMASVAARTSSGAADAADAERADAPDAADDAQDSADDRASRDVPSDMVEAQCDALRATWLTFVQQNRDCSSDSGCIIVAGAGACDCTSSGLGRPIGDPSGDPLSSAAADQARVYLDQWTNLGCTTLDKYCIADAARATNLRCELGKCAASFRSCNMPPPRPEPCR